MGSLTPLQKPDVTLSLSLSPSPTFHAITLKPEEIGIRLIQLLLKCAEHVTSGNLHRADACLAEITELASVTGNSMQRLASRFASALAIRLVKRWPGIHKALIHANQTRSDLDQAQAHFSLAFPYLRFAYAIIARTLIQSIGHERAIHIVDLGSFDPNLWISLLRGFANSPNGPPHLKITCVSTNKDGLDKLGLRLVKEAEVLDMPFQFNPINVTLRELTSDMIMVRPGESLAFISILSLHVLLVEDDRVDAHFGGSNKVAGGDVKDCKQMSDFLAMLRSMSPKLLFLVEQEAEHNLTKCFDRFVEGLYYYSAIFDSIDVTLGPAAGDDRFILEEMFGREIENIVACEGLERYERHERYGNWAVRLSRAGLKPVRLWYNCDEEDGTNPIIDAFGKDGYKIISARTSLMICWHERPLYAVTAWTWTC